MDLYTIYFDAVDFPGQFSARRFPLSLRGRHSDDHWSGFSLEGARQWVRSFSESRGAVVTSLFLRCEKDEPHIVEWWI